MEFVRTETASRMYDARPNVVEPARHVVDANLFCRASLQQRRRSPGDLAAGPRRIEDFQYDRYVEDSVLRTEPSAGTGEGRRQPPCVIDSKSTISLLSSNQGARSIRHRVGIR